MGQSKSKSQVVLEEISGITLDTIPTGKPFEARELWQSRPCLIFIVRRPGCPLCRDQAMQISCLQDEFSRLGINMYAVVYETEDVEGFKDFFCGDVFLDRERGFYKAQGDRWLGYHALFWPSVIKAINRARSRGVQGTNNGEGRRLGGLLIVKKEDVIFEHREQWFGDHADLDQALEAAKSIVGRQD